MIMSVYNSSAFLREAISSILNQSYQNFEFIIVDDGSVDESLEIIHSFHDPRIRVVKNTQNKGLAFSLNRAIELARTEYIVRMDADDISLPTRLERQVRFMEENKHISISGTWIKLIGAKSEVWKYPLSNKELSCHMIFGSPFAHPSVIIRRKDLLDKNLLYDENLRVAQDYDLWMRALRSGGLFANIPEVLLLYRTHPLQSGKVNNSNQVQVAIKTQQALLRLIGIDVEEEGLVAHCGISFCRSISLEEADQWLSLIYLKNLETNYFDQKNLKKLLIRKFQEVISRSELNLIETVKFIQFSRLMALAGNAHISFLKFYLKKLIK